MMTFEIKINGALIEHIYIHNLGICEGLKNSTLHHYKYQYYDIQGNCLTDGQILHDRTDGASILAAKVLEDIETKKNL